MSNLRGLMAILGLWLIAAGHVVAAVGFCVASLRTGKRRLYGPRLVASLLLAGLLVLGSFQLHRLSARVLDDLDATVAFWLLPVFLAGLFACFKVGKA